MQGGVPTGDFTLQTYHRQWIAEQDISRRIVRELIAEILHIAIDSLVDLFDFHGAFIDLVFFTFGGSPNQSLLFSFLFLFLYGSRFRSWPVHTDYGLGVFRPRCAQAELA